MVHNSGDRNRIVSRIEALNPMPDGLCRTLKATYFKTGRINFQHHNDWGTTGAMEIYETD